MQKNLSLALSLLLCAQLMAQTVFVDPAFNPEDRGFNYGGGFDAAVSDVVVLPDGRMIAGGWFTDYNGTPCSRIARLWPDGNIDTTYHIGQGFDAAVRKLALQPDGKLVALGYFFHANGIERWGIARLLADGSLDPTFDAGEIFYGQPESLALQPDGKVLMGGYQFCGNGTQVCIKRLNTDGSLDPTFNPGVGLNGNNEAITSMRVRADGKILIAGIFDSFNGLPLHNMALLNANGTVDTSFPNDLFNGTPSIRGTFPDGDMLVLGGFTRVAGVPKPHIAKVSVTGVLDPDFHAYFQFNSDTTANLYCAKVRADGWVIVGGSFTHCNGVSKPSIARLMPDGSLDPSFTTDGYTYGSFEFITELADGRLLVAGNNNGYASNWITGLSRVLPDGGNDLSFNPGSGFNNEVTAIATQPDGKSVVAGRFTRVNGEWTRGLVRVDQNGTLDPTFITGTGLMGYANDLAIRPDGRILVASAAAYNGPSLSRVKQIAPDGTLDPSFAPQTDQYGSFNSLLLQPDGKLLLTGSFSTIDGQPRRGIARLNEDGTVDSTFDPGNGPGTALPGTMALMADGRIVLGGVFMDTWGGNTVGNIVRLLPNGTQDPTFDTGTGFDADVYSVVVLPDGKVIAGGTFTSFNGTPRDGIARLNADGSLDTTFDPGTGCSSTWMKLALDIDGSVIVGGYFDSVDGTYSPRIVRLTTTGAVDPAFTVGDGFTRHSYYSANSATVSELELLPNGQIMVGGTFTGFDGVGRNRLVRLFAPTTVSVEEHASTANTINTWPSPNDGTMLRVSLPSLKPGTSVSFAVLDASGRMVWSQNRSLSGTTDLHFGDALAAGTYRLMVIADGVRSQTAFVVCRP